MPPFDPFPAEPLGHFWQRDAFHKMLGQNQEKLPKEIMHGWPTGLFALSEFGQRLLAGSTVVVVVNDRFYIQPHRAGVVVQRDAQGLAWLNEVSRGNGS